ncbi:unnamed protein product [Amaranthus hypochondriacus]
MKPEPAMGIPVGDHPQPSAPPAYMSNRVPQNQVVLAQDFSTALCDCCSDCSVCCLTLWCPCITFGRIAEIVDHGSSSCGLSGTLYCVLFALTGCQWIYSCTYRSKMKAIFGMRGDCCGDCCVHCCCEQCALCQEYRELQRRGYDPALGWHGNIGRANQGMTTPPSMLNGMNR